MSNQSGVTRLTAGRPATIDGWGAFCQLYVVAFVALSVPLASRFRELLEPKFRFDGDPDASGQAGRQP